MTKEEKIKYCEDNGLEYTVFDFSLKPALRNPNYQPDGRLENSTWVKSLYTNMLLMEVDENDESFLSWVKALNDGQRSRQQIFSYFQQKAKEENQKLQQVELKDLFDDNGKKRGLMVLKESLGDAFILTSLFESFHEQYPDHDLYIATSEQFAEIFISNPYVHKVLPYSPIFESELAFIGHGSNKKIVDVYFYPAIATQKHLNYLSADKIAFEINSKN